MVLLTACGGGSSKVADPTTTAPIDATTAVVVPDTPEPTTTVLAPPPAGTATTCQLLRDAIVPPSLRPNDTSNWNEERRRVIIDTVSDARLFGQAAEHGPAQLAASFTALAAHAAAVGEAMSASSSFADAIERIDGIASTATLAEQTAPITAWRDANC